jgi:transcription elongation factor Elf1
MIEMASSVVYKCPECGREDLSSKGSKVCPICNKQMVPECYVDPTEDKSKRKKPLQK